MVRVVAALIALLVSAGCTSSVTGVVESVEVVDSIIAVSSSGAVVKGESPFVGVTILSTDTGEYGKKYHAALSIEYSEVHGIKKGDAITVKLGRTAFRSLVPAHLARETDGMVRVVEPGAVGWRLIETYKFPQPRPPGSGGTPG